MISYAVLTFMITGRLKLFETNISDLNCPELDPYLECFQRTKFLNQDLDSDLNNFAPYLRGKRYRPAAQVGGGVDYHAPPPPHTHTTKKHLIF